jgi:hypothetical protein
MYLEDPYVPTTSRTTWHKISTYSPIMLKEELKAKNLLDLCSRYVEDFDLLASHQPKSEDHGHWPTQVEKFSLSKSSCELVHTRTCTYKFRKFKLYHLRRLTEMEK